MEGFLSDLEALDQIRERLTASAKSLSRKDLLTKVSRELRKVRQAISTLRTALQATQESFGSSEKAASSDKTLEFAQKVQDSLHSKTNWPDDNDVDNIFSSIQSLAVGNHDSAARRVVAAATSVDLRHASVRRIASLVVANAVDSHINNCGPAHREFRSIVLALSDGTQQDCDRIARMTRTGEWLTDFVGDFPMGAILMFGRQFTVMGDKIGVAQVGLIRESARLNRDLMSRAQHLTPQTCAAVRRWATACAFNIDDKSILSEILQAQEKRYTTSTARCAQNGDAVVHNDRMNTLAAAAAAATAPWEIEERARNCYPATWTMGVLQHAPSNNVCGQTFDHPPDPAAISPHDYRHHTYQQSSTLTPTHNLFDSLPDDYWNQFMADFN